MITQNKSILRYVFLSIRLLFIVISGLSLLFIGGYSLFIILVMLAFSPLYLLSWIFIFLSLLSLFLSGFAESRRVFLRMLGVTAAFVCVVPTPILIEHVRFRLEKAELVARLDAGPESFECPKGFSSCDVDWGPPARAAFIRRGFLDDVEGICFDPTDTIPEEPLSGERKYAAFPAGMRASGKIQTDWYWCVS